MEMHLNAIQRHALALYRDESGSEIMEYALITAVLSISVFVAFSSVSTAANNSLTGQVGSTAETAEYPALTSSALSPP
jgi:Flp pilus assembly pilin Flp